MDRGVDPAKAPLTEVAEFLENLRTIRHKGNPLAASTFAGYRSAIAAIHHVFFGLIHCVFELRPLYPFEGYLRCVGQAEDAQRDMGLADGT